MPSAPKARGMRSPLSLAAWLVVALAPIHCGPIAEARWTYHCATPVALGGVCLGEDECAPGLRCLSGRCAALARAGEACAGLHDCVDGYACLMTYAQTTECMATTCSEAGRDTGNCRTTQGTGRACDSALRCRPLEVCAVTDTGARGTCRPTPTEGQSCENFTGFNCTAGLICEITTKICRAPRLGGPCGVGTEDPSQVCGPTMGCDGRTDGSNICVARVAAGGACNLESCQAGYHCSVSTRVCERDLAEGSSCSAGNECGVTPGRRVDCVAGRCRATDTAGAVCWPGRYGCGMGLRCLRDR